MKVILFPVLNFLALQASAHETIASSLRGGMQEGEREARLLETFTACGATSCNSRQSCETNTSSGEETCECISGYTGAGCLQDEDECKTMDVCSWPGGYCENRFKNDRDGYACGCDTNGGLWKDGEESDIHGVTSCVAVDQCSDETHTCPSNATCITLLDGSSFDCICNDAGYAGESCNDDVDECLSDICGPNSVCTNSVGSFSCSCLEGFSSDEGATFCTPNNATETNSPPLTCEDINCDAVGRLRVCVMVDDKPSCECEVGWKSPNGKLGGCSVQLQECTVDGPGCGENQECTDIPGGFFCHCIDGYEDLGSGVCTDHNECDVAANNNPCNDPDFPICVNIPGSYVCDQAPDPPPIEEEVTDPPPILAPSRPFVPPPITCAADSCDANANCTVSSNVIQCECIFGFEGNGTVCIQFCTANACDMDATCTNTTDGIDCECNFGFEGDGTICDPIPVPTGALPVQADWLLISSEGFEDGSAAPWSGLPANATLWDSMFTATSPFYIRRICSDCKDSATHMEIVYKYIGDDPSAVDLENLFLEDFITTTHTLNKEFELYGSIQDAINGENMWMICNPPTGAGSTAQGFPQNCGPNRLFLGAGNWNDQTSSGSSVKHFAFYVWSGSPSWNPGPRCDADSCEDSTLALCMDRHAGFECTCPSGGTYPSCAIPIDTFDWQLVYSLGFKDEVSQSWDGGPPKPGLWDKTLAKFTGTFTGQNPGVSGNFFVRRLCADCEDTFHKDIVYKRIASIADTVDVSDLFLSDFIEADNMGINDDFELYGSEREAEMGLTPWLYCSASTAQTIGFPQNCGPSGAFLGSGNWNDLEQHGSSVDHFAFYVAALNPVLQDTLRCDSASCADTGAVCSDAIEGPECTCPFQGNPPSCVLPSALSITASPSIGPDWLLVFSRGFLDPADESQSWPNPDARPALWDNDLDSFTGEYTRQDTGAAGVTFYVRRICVGCKTASHADVVYKRLTALPAGLDVSDLFLDDFIIASGNTLNTDFELYSGVQDAINGNNRWTICGGVDHGFPGFCAPNAPQIGGAGNWNDITAFGSSVKNYAFYVWAGNPTA